MLTRAWFLVSMVWAALMFWNYSTREIHGPLSAFDTLFALAPLLAGVFLYLSVRYIVHGPRKRY
jgi:hypothetical protein